jgi:hypothetical protein
MIGAVAELDESRKVDVFGGTTPWWTFYVLGGVFLAALPILVARGVRWLMAVLAFFTAIKAAYLCFKMGRAFEPFDLLFAAAAAIATILLLRAFQRTGSVRRASP